jgi:hypothetical protein
MTWTSECGSGSEPPTGCPKHRQSYGDGSSGAPREGVSNMNRTSRDLLQGQKVVDT